MTGPTTIIYLLLAFMPFDRSFHVIEAFDTLAECEATIASIGAAEPELLQAIPLHCQPYHRRLP